MPSKNTITKQQLLSQVAYLHERILDIALQVSNNDRTPSSYINDPWSDIYGRLMSAATVLNSTTETIEELP